MVPPEVILAVGKAIWQDYIVGFFLDKPLSFTIVVEFLKKSWKLKGSVKVKFDGGLFLFHLTCEEDRIKILRSDPIFIRNKIFIIQQWSPELGKVRGKIKVVPVWLQLSNIPIYAWSHLGINWLANRIGKLICLDASTEKLDRINYARCLVEVTPENELVEKFPVMLLDGSEQFVHVNYLWKPEICVHCKVFGHLSDMCDNNVMQEHVEHPIQEQENIMQENKNHKR